MTTAPQWEAADGTTHDLLTLVADTEHPSGQYEWDEFVTALRFAATPDGTVSPNRLRPLLRGAVAPRRIGAFTNRALSQGLVAYTGEWEISDDTSGRNAGKPCRVMRLCASP